MNSGASGPSRVQRAVPVSEATTSPAPVNSGAPNDTTSPYAPDRTAGHELGVAREIVAGILRSIPDKYVTLDSRVNSLVSCAELAALRDRLDVTAATLDRESLALAVPQ